MKLAIIGNSHIGSLKGGWDALSSHYPDVETTFFGARRGGLSFIKAEGEKLVPTESWVRDSIRFTSGGREEIVPAEFDSILIYACNTPAFFLPSRRFYSTQVLTRAIEALKLRQGKNRLYVDLMQLVRPRFAGQLFIGHTPLSGADPKPTRWSTAPFVRGQKVFNEFLFLPAGASLISQPVETIVNGKFTDTKYSRGSTRLAVGDRLDGRVHDSTDKVHMNDEFGTLWLHKFFREISVKPTFTRDLVVGPEQPPQSA